MCFCHATPRNENDIFLPTTAEAALLPVFEGLRTRVVVCGHTHMQFERTVGGIRVVNAGSVGMPVGEPGADWLMLDSGIHLRHTNYDLGVAAARVRGTAYPQAAEFAESSILKPPSTHEMLQRFSAVELKEPRPE